MRFAFSSNAFTRFDLFEAIRVISNTGYEGIEIMADAPHAFPAHLNEADIRKIRNALEDNNLLISNINAFMHNADGDTYHPSWIEKEPELRAKRVDYTLRCIDLANKLGGRTISTGPGGPLEGITREEGLELFREGLSAVEESALTNNIRILIEPEPGLLIETSDQFMELFETLNPDAFGLNFDVGHFFCVGENPSDLVGRTKNITYHYHLEDIAPTREHKHLMLGEGAIDIADVLRTIEETGHDGFVTVELYTYEHAPEQAARAALEYLHEWRRTALGTDS